MVHVRWQVPGTHLPKGKTPGTEHKWVKEGRILEPQTRKQVKTVHSQPVGGLGRSCFLAPEGRQVQLPTLEARVSPVSAAGKVLHDGHSDSPQGLC